MEKPKILLGLTGSVSSIKLVPLLNELTTFAEVRVVSTRSASTFYQKDSIPLRIFNDDDEWSSWHKIGDEVLHIEMRRWADMLVIAPLSANTLAKVANGLCDNLLTCIVRAWDFQKPFLVAPAMNTCMWDHPYTARHLTAIKELGIHVIDPIPKKLACGDIGMGAMAEVSSIIEKVRQKLPQCSETICTK